MQTVFILISCVADRQGADLERPQDTPVAKQREVSYVVFGVPVEVQTPVEDMPKGMNLQELHSWTLNITWATSQSIRHPM